MLLPIWKFSPWTELLQTPIWLVFITGSILRSYCQLLWWSIIVTTPPQFNISLRSQNCFTSPTTPHCNYVYIFFILNMDIYIYIYIYMLYIIISKFYESILSFAIYFMGNKVTFVYIYVHKFFGGWWSCLLVFIIFLIFYSWKQNFYKNVTTSKIK